MVHNELIHFNTYVNYWLLCSLPSETAGHCYQCGETAEGPHAGMLHSAFSVSSHYRCCVVTKLWPSFEQDSQLPQFNETFLANLHSLKQQMNESEWKVKFPTLTWKPAKTKIESYININILYSAELWVLDALLADLPDGPAEANTPSSRARFLQLSFLCILVFSWCSDPNCCCDSRCWFSYISSRGFNNIFLWRYWCTLRGIYWAGMCGAQKFHTVNYRFYSSVFVRIKQARHNMLIS